MTVPACRIHKVAGVEALVDGRPMLLCAQCAIEGMDPQLGLGVPTARPATASRTVTQREEDVQRQIVQVLRQSGCTVLVTSRRRKRCVHCGKVSHGGDGADRGVPDLIVRKDYWTPARWLGIEVKMANGTLSEEQAELLREGGIVVARNVDDALRAVEAHDVEYDPYRPRGDEGNV